MSRPPLAPLTAETAAQKARLAEDARHPLFREMLYAFGRAS
jgi:nuclear transport factor 2 (NTF2) superfamily protein